MTPWPLLRTRRFGALFWTQFFGAFNDNLFKNALVILIAYQTLAPTGMPADRLVVFCSGLFILPFFLFSATAGQLGDKLQKARMIRWIKAAEIVIMAVAAFGFLTERLWLLLAVLFFMGLQSTFFGPVKYSILPQLLDEDELVGGNALVETGTFLAILLGTITGGLLVARGAAGLGWVSTAVLTVAAAGYATSFFIPYTTPENPELAVAWNPVRPTLETYRLTRKDRTVFLSVLGIAWFWFFGASLLALLPSYTKDVLGADQHVITLFLALFCTGIAAGSLLCERLSDHKLELGLVPLGSVGMTIFAFDLFLVGQPTDGPPFPQDILMNIGAFLETAHGLRITADLVLLATFSGFFIVPLYTLVQQRSETTARSRVIAGNNILGACFMVLSSVMLITLLAVHLTIPAIFLVLALLNGAFAFRMYRLVPEFVHRFAAWMLAHVMYRVRATGREHLPREGPALLVCNHVTKVDWLIIASVCKRPIRFVMSPGLLKLPFLGWLFRDVNIISTPSTRESAETHELPPDRIASALAGGHVVCIFPEGTVTKDGRMQPFRPGLERIVERTPVPVIPMALRGLWGSFFGSRQGLAMRGTFRRFWSRVDLEIGAPLAPEAATAPGVAERIATLGGFEAPPAWHPTPPSARAAR